MPTVYATRAPERFYLLPDDHSLPAGELYIRSLTGDELEVNAQAVQKYAISEDDAKKHVRVQMAGIAKRTKAAMAGAGQVMRQLAEATRQAKEAGELTPKAAAELEQAAHRATRAETRHSAARQRMEEREATITDALGLKKGALKEDPLALFDGLKSFMDDLATNLEVYIDPDTDPTIIAGRLKLLNDAIVANGGTPIASDAVASPETFREWLGDPARLESLRQATKSLRDEAEQLRKER